MSSKKSRQRSNTLNNSSKKQNSNPTDNLNFINYSNKSHISPSSSQKIKRRINTPSNQIRNKSLCRQLSELPTPNLLSTQVADNNPMHLEIAALRKINSTLKKKLLKITRISKEKLTKVSNELEKTRRQVRENISAKFQEYYNILQGFLITVLDVKVIL